MDDGANEPQGFRARMHQMMRESILDAASAAAGGNDWADVRIADLAETVGVSRQTIYNEFGTKDQLGAALFEREITRFGDGMVEQVRVADSLRSAVRRAFNWMFREAAEDQLVSRILAAHQLGDRESLLPVLTIRADLLLRPLRIQLAEAFLERWHGPTPAEAERVAEMVIRMGLSQVVSPSSLLTVEEYVESSVEMTVAHTLMFVRQTPVA